MRLVEKTVDENKGGPKIKYAGPPMVVKNGDEFHGIESVRKKHKNTLYCG